MKLYEIAKTPSDIEFVSRDGNNIRFIDNPIEAVQLAAVTQYYGAIRHIKNPSEAVQLAAIDQYYWAITHIKNPSEAAQIAVINANVWAIRYIDNPTTKVLLIALKDSEFINDKEEYDNFIKWQFANNTLLMKKWLRYGETMRNQE
jgi:hypothetical protein